MKKKLGKSMVATGIAATTLMSGMLGNQIKAEEVSKPAEKNQPTQQMDADRQTNAEISKTQAELAKAQEESQEETVNKAKSEYDTAQEVNQKAKEELKEAEQQVNTTALAEAQNEEIQTKVEVSSNIANLADAQNKEASAQQAIQEQENKVIGQQSLVDLAEKELAEAKAPIAREEQELAQAKVEEEQAIKDLALKKEKLAAIQDKGAQAPNNATKLEQSILSNQVELEKIKEEIKKKEAELATTPKKKIVSQAADFRTTNYVHILNYLQENGQTPEVREAASNALSLYKQAKREDGLTIGTDSTSSASLENNFKAIEVIRAINRYRVQAGLPELYVDPYANVASQIQSAFFEKNGRHMFKYIKNENVAISFSPEKSVDFWHSEKALYQKIAAQYNLPTDEKQLDANAIYQKIGAETFARVGHYLQMMDNKATAISASYNTIPNAYSSVYGTAAVGFHHVGNTAQRLQNKTLLSLSDYEQLLKSATQPRIVENERATVLKNELAALRVEKTNREVKAGILASQLNDGKLQAQKQAQLVANAQYQVLNAESKLAAARENTVAKRAALENASKQFETSLQPKKLALQLAKEKLAEETAKLERLKAELQTLKQNTLSAQERLADSKTRLKNIQEKVDQLAKAPQKVSTARQTTSSAKTVLSKKENKLQQEESLLSLYREVAAKLEDKQRKLQTKATDNTSSISHLSTVNAASTKPADAKKLYKGDAVMSAKNQSSKSKKEKSLPQTGTNAEYFSLLGLATGIVGVTIANASEKKKKYQ